MKKDELIPGLPDCLALDCLLRLPFHAISDARAVCKRWKYELDSPSFYRIRKAAGFAHRIVSLLLLSKRPSTVGELHLALYEPDMGVFTLRKLAPNRPNLTLGSCDATVVGRELVVIGGWDALKNRHTGEVNIYDLITGAWRRGAPNPDRVRPRCRYGLKGGKVVTVREMRGRRYAEGDTLPSALIYDVASDTWLEMVDVGRETSICDDKFWESREELDSVIRYWRKLSSFEDDDDVLFRTTEDEKEIVIYHSNKNLEEKITILREDVLDTLRQRLGLRPNEVVLYLQSYYRGRL